MKKMSVLFFGFLLLIALLYPALAGNEEKNPADMTMEDFYQVKAFRGRTPQNMQFSQDDRFLAFIWNPYNVRGADLYVYNVNLGKMIQVTSIERMKQFDPAVDYERFKKKEKQKNEEDEKLQWLNYAYRDYLMGKKTDLEKFEREELDSLKKELEEEKKKAELEKEKKKKEEETLANSKIQTEDSHSGTSETKKAVDGDKQTAKDNEGEKDKKSDKGNDKEKDKEKELELWELRDKLREKKEKDKIKDADLYPGVREYKWSEKAQELIFQYRDDLYRYFPSEDRLVRLTMTDDKEYLISYTPSGDGYYYGKDQGGVYLVRFGSSYICQLTHQFKADKEEEQFQISRTYISPNGRWMMVLASKEDKKATPRKVSIMSYKKRFAESIQVDREVADDKRNEPQYRFYLREIQEKQYAPEATPVFETPGGDIWYEFSDIEWSKDGSRYAFMTWEREKGDLKIWVGAAAPGKKPELLFEMKEKIGYKNTYDENIKFTPDGKSLAAVLTNADGFRQPVLFNLDSREKKVLITGKFESFILSFSKNGRNIYVLSDKEDTALSGVYKVRLDTLEMTPVGKQGGMVRNAVVSSSGDFVAAVFGNFNIKPELFFSRIAAGGENVLTDSHRKDWDNYLLIRPELFKYKNRHGHIITGMVFKPKDWKKEDLRPCVVYMYGGPLGTRHTVETDLSSGLSFMFQMIMAAKHGYVAINIDPRGQSGFGAEFNEANWENPGNSQVEDLEDLAGYIGTGFGVDKSRLGLHGWSFGGYQTIKTFVSSPETFACGIATASVTEWENYNSWYAAATIGKSERGKTALRKYSLIPLAKNLKNPLLLVHGMMDANVLYQDTLNMYRAFLEAGKEKIVEIFLDPEGEHGLRGTVQDKAVFNKYESWFLTHLGSAEKPK